MKNSELGTWIDGIIATEDLDSSGERIKIEGIDISSVFENKDAFFNWEHKNDTPSQIVGKIVDVKKITKKSDCDNPRHEYYWKINKEKPYLYGCGILFDEVGHSTAKDVLAIFKFAKISKDKDGKSDIGFSIEGSRLGKEGSNITKCILRSTAITQKPCNKACIAELMDSEDVDKYTKKITKNKILETFKKHESLACELQKAEPRTYFKELGVKKKPGGRFYTKITTATGEHREGKPVEPKRTFTSQTAPEKIRVGDKITHNKRAKAGATFYRDLYKDLDNPIRKGIMKKKQKGVHEEHSSAVDQGVSTMGVHSRNSAKAKKMGAYNAERKAKEDAKRHSQENLKELKQMPKPNLPKSEKAKILKSLANEAWENFKHKELLIETIKKKEPELSDPEVIGIAKTYAYIDMKKSEAELTDMFEKSKVKKAKVDENKPWGEKRKIRRERNEAGKGQKGVHRQVAIGEQGESFARPYKAPKDIERQLPGTNASYKKRSLDAHKKVIQEQKEMPKPNLPKSEKDVVKKDRCWDGYKPVEGKKPYSKGSCAPINKAKVDEGKSKEEKQQARKERNSRVKFAVGSPEGEYKGKKVRPRKEGEGDKVFGEPKKPVKKNEKPFHGYNKEKHSKEGGLNDKERERINREEGRDLKRPVTGKVKAGSKASKRKKSFCARMSGVKGPTSKDGKLTPKGASLKRWNCSKNEDEN